MLKLKVDKSIDGGHFRWALNIVERYGLIPQQLCPESYSSSNTYRLNELVSAKVSFEFGYRTVNEAEIIQQTKLREFVLELQAMYTTNMPVLTGAGGMTEEAAAYLVLRACKKRKGEQMGVIYVILATCLGTPPSPKKRFSYDFYDKDGKHQNLQMTPLEMFADLAEGFKPQEHLTLWHRPDLEPAHRYEYENETNVVGGKGLDAVNTTMEVMEDAVVKMIQADLPV